MAGAQILNEETIHLRACLHDPLIVSIDNSDVVFEFNTLDDYQNGIGGFGSEFSTNATIKSNSDLTIKCISKSPFTNTDSSDEISLTQVNYSIGQNNSADLLIEGNLAESNSHKIQNNSSGINNNDIVIYWEIDTTTGQSNELLSSLKPGIYTTNVAIVIAEEI